MNRTIPTQLWLIARTAMGILMCGVGLYLASLSDPRLYTMSASDDRYIYGYLVAGLDVTLAGVALFLHAVTSTTHHMPSALRREINTSVGIGFALQLAGLWAAAQLPQYLIVASVLLVPGVAVFTWGTMIYALGKGYAKVVGLLGILGVIGLVLLILLPQRRGERG